MHHYIATHKDRFLNELSDFLRIPSVSTKKEHASDMQKAAQFVADKLSAAGAEHVAIMETGGHPVVYGDVFVSKHAPTVLVYGHYDVQPAEPLSEWKSPAFGPEVRDGNIYARGATDDKGQVFIHIKALEVMRAENDLPCNIKFLIEGEEELGSPNLPRFCARNKKLLKADLALVSDTSIVSENIPGIETGLRGLVYFQLDAYGANTDLHSGLFGGAVPNPLNALSSVIASLHSKDGTIAISGLYVDVQKLSKKERAALNRMPHNDRAYQKALGLTSLSGEKGFTTIERTTTRPSLDAHGIWGGFMGEGSKTVLPREAHAKVSIRLVPNQHPEKVAQLFENHIKKHTPAGIRITVTRMAGIGHPYVMPTSHIGYQAAAKALYDTFKKQPIPLRSGGSIPVIPEFERILGIKSVLLGFGLPTDNLHAPNEHFSLKNFYRGIETIPLFYKHLAAAWKK